MKPLPIVLVVLAVIFAILGVLYATGNLNLLATPASHHYKHAITAFVLAIACLVGANFARQRAAV